MRLEVKSDYRKASKPGAIGEDAICKNEDASMFAVCDGVDGPYSPSNPRHPYGKRTGGQMVGEIVKFVVENAAESCNLYDTLLLANSLMGVCHESHKKSLANEAVAGACVAACQVKVDTVSLVLVGDCFAFWCDETGMNVATNFDQSAFDFEQKGDEAFRQCVEVVDQRFPETKGKNLGRAWDEFFPRFGEKQFFRANRNLGNGGHAMLNGDPDLPRCWTTKEIPLVGLQWMLFCTDGLLPPHLMVPMHHDILKNGVQWVFERLALEGLGVWRDKMVAEHEAEVKGSDTPHIEGHPEGSVLAIRFLRG